MHLADLAAASSALAATRSRLEKRRLLADLLASSRHQTYFKTDAHWSSLATSWA